MNGPEARELLSLYYQVKGLPEADALHMVSHIANDPDQLLRALTTERLGSSEESLSNPLVSASSGALSTAIGATIPIIPFFFMSGLEAVIAAAVISLIAHFAVGAAKSLITVRSWWSSGLGDDCSRRGRRRRHLRDRYSAGQGRHVMGGLIPLGDASRRPRGFAAVTLLIIVVNAYVFLLELSGGNRFVRTWSAIPYPHYARPSRHHAPHLHVHARQLDAHHRQHGVPVGIWPGH